MITRLGRGEPNAPPRSTPVITTLPSHMTHHTRLQVSRLSRTPARMFDRRSIQETDFRFAGQVPPFEPSIAIRLRLVDPVRSLLGRRTTWAPTRLPACKRNIESGVRFHPGAHRARIAGTNLDGWIVREMSPHTATNIDIGTATHAHEARSRLRTRGPVRTPMRSQSSSGADARGASRCSRSSSIQVFVSTISFSGLTMLLPPRRANAPAAVPKLYAPDSGATRRCPPSSPPFQRSGRRKALRRIAAPPRCAARAGAWPPFLARSVLVRCAAIDSARFRRAWRRRRAIHPGTASPAGRGACDPGSVFTTIRYSQDSKLALLESSGSTRAALETCPARCPWRLGAVARVTQRDRVHAVFVSFEQRAEGVVVAAPAGLDYLMVVRVQHHAKLVRRVGPANPSRYFRGAGGHSGVYFTPWAGAGGARAVPQSRGRRISTASGRGSRVREPLSAGCRACRSRRSWWCP